MKVKFVPMGEHQHQLYLNGFLICYLSNSEVTRIQNAEMVEKLDALEAIEE